MESAMATHGVKVGPQDWQLFSIYPSQNEGSLISIYIYIYTYIYTYIYIYYMCVCQYVYNFESYPNICRCMAKTGHWEPTPLWGWPQWMESDSSCNHAVSVWLIFFVLRGLHGLERWWHARHQDVHPDIQYIWEHRGGWNRKEEKGGRKQKDC